MVEICPVCYDYLENDEILACKHKVHKQCIVDSGKAECPICRSTLDNFIGKVSQLMVEQPELSILDKLSCYGYLHPNDIPILDNQGITTKDDLTIVKAALIAFVIRSNW